MPELRRSLSLPLVLLYGLGVTIIETGALLAIIIAGEQLGITGGNEALVNLG